jgi:CubicO group peptidase (beta-lactamase class C family)
MSAEPNESPSRWSTLSGSDLRVGLKPLRIGAAILSLGLVGGWAWMQQPDADPIGRPLAAGPQWAEDFKDTRWPEVCDEQAAVLQKPFAELSRLVGGSGFVAKDGKAVFRWGNDHHSHYVASTMKPFLSALLLLAVEQGLVASLDSQVAEVVPELKTLNQGIDAGITWRQLATMTSGYGLEEAPGEAFAYNDFAVQLFYDALIHGVFGECGDEVLRRELAGPLGFEDPVTFRGFGEDGPEPKMRASARDLARFGQWLLDGKILVDGSDREELPASIREQLISLVLDESIPMTSATPAAMLEGQESVGGGHAGLDLQR